jgi:hypothetical protein
MMKYRKERFEMALPASMLDLNLWAVLTAGLANMIACLILYLPKLFGNAWVKLTGKDLNPARPWIAAGISGHLVNALVIAVIVNIFNARTLLQGMGIGILVCLGFILPVETGELVWDKIPFRLFMMRVGIPLVAECISAIILVAWR